MSVDVLGVRGSGIKLRTGIARPQQKRQRPFTCSPQMTRCILQPTMSIPMFRRHSAQSDLSTVSIDDVYLMAERERARSSYRNRCEVLKHAQKQVRRDDDLSRPYSSISQFQRNRESATPKSLRSGLSSAHSTFKPNSPDVSDFTTTVVEQCCDVMGPGMCCKCQKHSSRILSSQSTDITFPSLRVAQQNVTTTALVKRIFPDLTREEIQDKIARGEIAQSLFSQFLRNSNDNNEESQADEDREQYQEDRQRTACVIAKMNQAVRHNGQASTPMYFNNIRDLNYKIVSGKVSRDMAPAKPNKSSSAARTRWKSLHDKIEYAASRRKSVSEALFPTFISPRKVTMIEEPAYKVYFGPPLLARENQLPKPSFFAGSDFVYKLPERLPDKLVFVKQRSRVGSAISVASSSVGDDPFEYDMSLANKLDNLE